MRVAPYKNRCLVLSTLTNVPKAAPSSVSIFGVVHRGEVVLGVAALRPVWPVVVDERAVWAASDPSQLQPPARYPKVRVALPTLAHFSGTQRPRRSPREI